MRRGWLTAEHHRIHVIDLWPEGPRKEVRLTAARSALDSLARAMPKGSSFGCSICASRRQTVTVIPCAPFVDMRCRWIGCVIHAWSSITSVRIQRGRSLDRTAKKLI